MLQTTEAKLPACPPAKHVVQLTMQVAERDWDRSAGGTAFEGRRSMLGMSLGRHHSSEGQLGGLAVFHRHDALLLRIKAVQTRVHKARRRAQEGEQERPLQ